MSVRVHLLLGGLTRWGDGYVTSRGMYGLADRLKRIPGVDVAVYPWADVMDARRALLMDELKQGEKIALIGYSGGGSRATWIANMAPRPKIDLMVLYDPSPAWEVEEETSLNVRQAICYYNTSPMMWVPFIGSLGGGRITGPQVTIVPIAMQHLLVQYDQALHKRTVVAVERLAHE